MKNKETGYVLINGELKKSTKRQRFGQWWYGFSEPHILRFADFMLRTDRRTKIYLKMRKPKSLPSGVIISTEAAKRFVDFIYDSEKNNSSARMAVTDCVCQTALKRYKEPRKKDMALLYAADMYTTLKHTGIKEDFEQIESKEEAKKMLDLFHHEGLMHNVLYCNHSGKWTFVMCNCDNEICVPFRTHVAGKKDEMNAGPEIISLDIDKCVGIDDCGICLERCILGASFIEGLKTGVNLEDCLGCGLCVTTCKGNARTLIRRENYQHEDVITTKILLGD